MKEKKKGEKMNPGAAKDVTNTKQKDVTEAQRAKRESDLKKFETYFNDGIRTVDFVLAWDSSQPSAKEPSASEKRKNFENNLAMEGLKLEYEPVESGSTLNFVKIHAPIEVLRRFAEILKLRMPMKKELFVGSCNSKLKLLLQNTFLDEGGLSNVSERFSQNENDQFLKDKEPEKFDAAYCFVPK